ncbi:2747_t:CDS:1, partial [Acaulospora morrowiae]
AVSCILSVALGYYAYATHEKFNRTIIYLKSIEPILASAKVAAERVDKWIENVAEASVASNTDRNETSNSEYSKETNSGQARIFLDDHHLKERKMILKRIFDAIAIINADLRRSFILLDN